MSERTINLALISLERQAKEQSAKRPICDKKAYGSTLLYSTRLKQHAKYTQQQEHVTAASSES